jgi:hypothetical protein
MRITLQLITLLALPTLVWADSPSDLRASLQRLHGQSPISVNVDYSNRREVDSLLKPIVSQGSVHLRLSEDESGLHSDWAPHQLSASSMEERQANRDPLAMTPVRDAMKQLDAGSLHRMLNQAGALSEMLDGAKFKHEGEEMYQGNPARVLVFSFNPTIRPDHLGRVSRSEATLKVWIRGDGLPLATESHMDYAGKHSRLFGRFHMRSLVKTTYAVFGDHLVVVSRTSEDLSYDTGEKVKDTKTLNFGLIASPEPARSL